MKSITAFGVNYSPRAYRGTVPAEPPILVAHQFDALPDGRLLHSMDGRQAAIVPPEGLRDYAEAWPDCKPVVAELLAAEQSAGATVAPGTKSGKMSGGKKGARRR